MEHCIESGRWTVSIALLEYNITCSLASLHPLVYNSTPHPQWSSGYDFRLSLTPTSRGRPGFDSLLRSIQSNDSSSIVKSSGAGSPASFNFFPLLFCSVWDGLSFSTASRGGSSWPDCLTSSCPRCADSIRTSTVKEAVQCVARSDVNMQRR
jgi:hypothetical protein